MVRLAGVEPATLGLEVLRAIDPLGSYFSYFVGLDESMETR